MADVPLPTIDNLLWIQLVLELEEELPGLAKRVASRVADLAMSDNVRSARFWTLSPEFETMVAGAAALSGATARVAKLRREGSRLPGPGAKVRKRRKG